MLEISVIVPVYNVRDYLDACLESLAMQSLKDIEIIIVDDCSPDECWRIAEGYTKKDRRFSLVRHEKNMRQGGARNTGIRRARGEYIAFVDGDDIAEPAMLEQLLAVSRKTSADIVECGMSRFTKDSNSRTSFFLPQRSGVISGNEALKALLRNETYRIYPGPCNKLFSRKILQDVIFPENMFFEDLPFIIEAISKSSIYAFLSQDLYLYRIHEGSTTRKINEDHISGMFSALSLSKASLERAGKYDGNEKDFYSLYYRHAIKYLLETTIGRNTENPSDKDRYARLIVRKMLESIKIEEVLPYLGFSDIRRVLTALDNEWADFPRLSFSGKLRFMFKRANKRFNKEA